MGEKFGKLPSELLALDIADLNLNISVLNYGAMEDYRNELIGHLKGYGMTASGNETVGQLERLIKAKQESRK